ncbi:VanZ family protein [Pseudoalteromonas sp. PPB1]|uniref:VanZ family protein n=1 Tax=Pseudoalteromonas sp. PPB1 TaxID=2756136 RepID=UPI001E405C09|nr:VanZ family protein [Pseudoalteromonas sp. PPB1]
MAMIQAMGIAECFSIKKLIRISWFGAIVDSEYILKPLLNLIQLHWLSFTALIALLITGLSLYPVDSLPAVPGTDKTHHFIAYGALAFPVALARPERWSLFIIGFLVYSGVIELVQPYVNRYGEWLDLGANGLGLLVGVLFASFSRSIFLKEKFL